LIYGAPCLWVAHEPHGATKNILLPSLISNLTASIITY